MVCARPAGDGLSMHRFSGIRQCCCRTSLRNAPHQAAIALAGAELKYPLRRRRGPERPALVAQVCGFFYRRCLSIEVGLEWDDALGRKASEQNFNVSLLLDYLSGLAADQ